MILSFSQQINQKPVYFAEKIWAGISDRNDIKFIHRVNMETCQNTDEYAQHYNSKHTFSMYVFSSATPKLHSIREDKGERWKEGQKIHPVYFCRSKKQYQFAPTLFCKSTQIIEICWTSPDNKRLAQPTVKIDGRQLTSGEITSLAFNDGFSGTDMFFEWFNADFKGKIIHWTDLKY